MTGGGGGGGGVLLTIGAWGAALSEPFPFPFPGLMRGKGGTGGRSLELEAVGKDCGTGGAGGMNGVTQDGEGL